MPPWNAAATRVSSACVTAAGSVSVRCPAVPAVSRTASSPLARQQQRRLAELAAPERKLLRQHGHPAHAPQAARAQRRNDVPRAGSATACPRRDRLPGRQPGPAPGSATTPHRPQDDGSSASSRPGSRRTGIKPHRLHHHAGRRIKPALRGLRRRRDQSAQARLVDTAQHRPAADSRRPQPPAAAQSQGRHSPSAVDASSRSRSAS